MTSKTLGKFLVFSEFWSMHEMHLSLVQCRLWMNTWFRFLFSSWFCETQRFFKMVMKSKNIAAEETRLYPLKSSESQLLKLQYCLISWPSGKILPKKISFTKSWRIFQFIHGRIHSRARWTIECFFKVVLNCNESERKYERNKHNELQLRMLFSILW